MGFIRNFISGIIILVAGFGTILIGIECMPPQDEMTAAENEADVPAAPSDASAPAVSDEAPPPPAKVSPTPSTPPPAPAPAPASGDVGNPANAALHINDAGLAIIEESEGLRLEAYQGPGGWYIGYGHSGAQSGQKISESEAVSLLRSDVKGAEDYVRRLVTAPLNENEFSALVSYCFNVGGGNFGKSDILQKVNAGDRKGAADAFLHHNTAGGKVIEHLTSRREKERALFLTPA